MGHVSAVSVCVLLAELDKLKFGVKRSTKYTSGEARVYHNNLHTLPVLCLKTKSVEMAVCNFTWTGKLGVPFKGKILDWGSWKQGAEENILAQ